MLSNYAHFIIKITQNPLINLETDKSDWCKEQPYNGLLIFQ